MPPIGVLVMAYGGPRSLDEVEPYLLDVRGGRPTPPEIVHEVRERYRRIGGGSPILERTRSQAKALERALNNRREERFRAFVGMRHCHPYIHETLREMRAAGIWRAVGLVMAPHYSRMSVGAYVGKVQDAASRSAAPGGGATGSEAPGAGTPRVQVACIESWNLLPGYLDALVERVERALQRFPPEQRRAVPVLCTAHSLPQRIREWNDPYERELSATVTALAARLEPQAPGAGARGGSGAGPRGRAGTGHGEAGGAPSPRCHFAFQSAALTPEPWLGPDAGELISRFAAEKRHGVVIAPIGFVSEHLEILYDIDIVLREQAERAGLRLERIDMLNDAPALILGLAERVRGEAAERGWL